jgi:ABC-type lipoprotein export system ATPase subunit
MSFIEVKNASKYYVSGEEKVAALRQVDFSVEAGEVIMVTHNPYNACFAHRLIKLKDGRIDC